MYEVWEIVGRSLPVENSSTLYVHVNLLMSFLHVLIYVLFCYFIEQLGWTGKVGHFIQGSRLAEAN